MPADYVSWIERLGSAANRPALQAPDKVVCVSGKLSPLAQKNFTARGWKIYETFTIAAGR